MPLEGVDSVEMNRGLDRGFRERVKAFLPVVATVSPGVSETSAPADIPAAALLAAHDREISVWNLADLGVPYDWVRRADQPLRYGQPRPRHPRLCPIAAPNPALPAFERIQELVRGSVQRRGGRMIQGPAEAIVEEIFTTLKDEGWLNHL
jgi:electron transfer flavoprotein alpha/beta subunit